MKKIISFQDNYLGIFTRSFLLETDNYNVFIDGGLSSGLTKKKKYLSNGKKNILLLTHGHWDHIGSNSGTKKYNGDVFIHSGDERHIWDYRWHWQLLFGQFKNDFDLSQERFTTFWEQVGKPIRADYLLNDGQTLTFDDVSFEVVPIPGHSNGSVGFFEQNSEILFCGDSIIGNGFFNGTPQICNFDKYLTSMLWLEQIRPKQIMTAHTAPQKGQEWEELLQSSYKCAKRIVDSAVKYADANKESICVREVAKAIASAEGKKVGGGTCVSALAALCTISDRPQVARSISDYICGQ